MVGVQPKFRTARQGSPKIKHANKNEITAKSQNPQITAVLDEVARRQNLRRRLGNGHNLRLTSRRLVQGVLLLHSNESLSKPGTKLVYPNQCEELQRRPNLILAGIVPY